MRQLKTMVALLLAVLWLPVSSHALLEHCGLIHQVHGDHHHDDGGAGSPHEHSSHDHHAADGLMVAPAGKVKPPAPEFVAAPGWLISLLWTAPGQMDSAAPGFGLSPPHAMPAELSRRWQFHWRAALPIRAPSFAS